MFSLLVGLGALLLAVFVSVMLDPRPSRSAAAAERPHSDDGCDHLSYARARPHTIGSSLFMLRAAQQTLHLVRPVLSFDLDQRLQFAPDDETAAEDLRWLRVRPRRS